MRRAETPLAAGGVDPSRALVSCARLCTLLLVGLCGLPVGCRKSDGTARPVALRTGEIVTNPTTDSVQIGLVPAQPAELYASFAPEASFASGDDAAPGTESTTGTIGVDAGELAVLTLDGLAPGTRYRARVHLRRPGDDGFAARPGVRFRTLREDSRATVRFAYTADSHIVGRLIQNVCVSDPESQQRIANFRRTLDHLLASDVDFVVAGGDNFMLEAPLLQACDRFEGYGNGTVRTAEQADLRYELGLSQKLWGRVAKRMPFLYVLGNHDGEARFGDARGSYGHFLDTRELSRGARLRHLPDPTSVYDGSRDGDLYFSFTSGPARFIVLDVMAGPTRIPHRAEDWTLGEAQWSWLEDVLARNRSPWTFVFAEHLVGGVRSPDGRPLPYPGGPPGDYHYGRGGLRATVDRTPRGRFLGEQAELQALLRRYGADVFFHAHDHVAVVGEKLAPDGRGEGVYYVMGGQASADMDGPNWATSKWFRDEMDYDLDGRPDYEQSDRGTVRAGFYRVTVEGGERVVLEYVRSDRDDAPVAFRFTILPDGSSRPSLASGPHHEMETASKMEVDAAQSR